MSNAGNTMGWVLCPLGRGARDCFRISEVGCEDMNCCCCRFFRDNGRPVCHLFVKIISDRKQLSYTWWGYDGDFLIRQTCSTKLPHPCWKYLPTFPDAFYTPSGQAKWLMENRIVCPRSSRTCSLLLDYNPGQKYMVHLENLLCFHYRPLFDDKSGSFSQTWPSPLPPIQCCFKGDTLSALTQHCTGGGGGGGGRNGEIVKKGQVYHYFWPGL